MEFVVAVIETMCKFEKLHGFVTRLCASRNETVSLAACEATTRYMMKERRF